MSRSGDCTLADIVNDAVLKLGITVTKEVAHAPPVVMQEQPINQKRNRVTKPKRVFSFKRGKRSAKQL